MPKQIKIDSEIIKKQLLNIVDKYGKLPENLRFDNDIFDLNKALGVNKTAKLLYDGKKDLRTIIDKTISAPFQEIRKFGESEEKSEIKCEKNWYNKLIYGDNLQALKYLLDNGYKEQIKLIYIDPPFATKSDFAKGETKAYRDKLEGAEFIEFIRERLILMKELLSKDGFIFVHLDDKKGHYIKVILDEIFLEANFRNDIVWTYNGKGLANTKTKFIPYNGNIYFYSKNPQTPINNRTGGISKSVMQRFGRYLNEYNQITFKSLKDNNETAELKKATKSFIKNNKREPIDEDIAVYYDKGTLLKNIWNDIGIIRENHKYNEYTGYPTQKPKKLLERILNACSLENDLILDAFIGSGTTCAVAEKLNRRWIGIDAGKLAIYTSQKRILDIQNHKPFIVINSGVYEIRDLDNQVNIDDNLYKDFACDLFQVDKNKGEKINGVDFSGKYGNNYVHKIN
ncbi:MAG: site-specific DNA-methyltransferase [Deltaproteobacteria bacterium]|nr:site-specific DNA-methyltransferase [Deltaproteobacteria bacterium]